MKRLIPITILILITSYLVSQTLHQAESFTFDVNNPVPTGDHIFEAVEFVEFLNGSEYNPVPGESLEARINPYLLFPPPGPIYGGPNPGDDGVVGSLESTFSVSSSGSATLSIPIDLPAGIKDIRPNLSLTYTSQGGKGLLGLGWQISGLSVITRAGTDYYHDGFPSEVDFTNDKFLLDGNRLCAINGQYGASGTIYSTEISTFSKIISFDQAGEGPDYFKVWEKDGLILSFGETEDSKIKITGKEDIYAWLISRIEDRQGNYITFIYGNNIDEGENWIEQVKYTGNTTTNQMPFYTIDFIYEDRPDLENYFVDGVKFLSTKRLKEIKVKYLNTIFKSYSLTYRNIDGYYSETNTTNSLLEKIDVYGYNNTKMNPTIFNYSISGVPEFANSVSWSSAFTLNQGWNEDFLRLIGDINGDSRSDIVGFGDEHVYYSFSTNNSFSGVQEISANTFSNSQGWSNFIATPRYLADINGDGMYDIIGFGYDNIAIAFSNGNGFNPPQNSIGAFVFNQGWTENYLRLCGDINGDGREDIVGFGNDAISYSLSNGTGFDTPVESINAFTTSNGWGEPSGLCWQSYFKYHRLLSDINGDGLKDIIGFHDRNFYYSLAIVDENGVFQGFDNAVECEYATPDLWYYNASNPHFLADINGDGKNDIIECNFENIYYYLANGNGFESPISTPNPNNIFCRTTWNQCVHIRTTADVNGDNKQDLVGIGENAVYVAIANGEGFEVPQIWATGYTNSLGWNFQNNPRFFSDVNGDGCADIVGFGNDDILVSTSLLQSNNRLVKISNEFGIMV